MVTIAVEWCPPNRQAETAQFWAGPWIKGLLACQWFLILLLKI
jgi:hypothetical protein